MTICYGFCGAIDVDIIEISLDLDLHLFVTKSRKVERYARGRNQLKAQDRAEDDGMAKVSASGVSAIVFHVSVSVRSS